MLFPLLKNVEWDPPSLSSFRPPHLFFLRMPTLRSRFFYTVASDDKGDQHTMLSRSAHIPSLSEKFVAETSQRQRMNVLEQVSDLRLQLNDEVFYLHDA